MSIQSLRRQEATEAGLKAWQWSPPPDGLRHETRVLRQEAQLVRARSQELRMQLQAAFADQQRLRAQLSKQARISIYDAAPLGMVAPNRNRRSQDDKSRFSASALAAVEEERSRLARELHDDLNQQIAWLQLKVSSLEVPLTADPELFDAERRLLARGLRELSDKISRISRELHPAILTDLGLGAAVRAYVADFAENERVKAVFRCKALPPHIPANIGICLYRILQEALHNVSKHAKTQRLSVTLSCSVAAGLRLSVRDYGIGMPSRVVGRRGLGLISMQERARLANGTFAIRSQKGRGTEIVVQVPLEIPRQEEAADQERRRSTAP